MSEITIAPATAADLEPIKELLLAAGLPTAGVDDHWKTFIVAREERSSSRAAAPRLISSRR